MIQGASLSVTRDNRLLCYQLRVSALVLASLFQQCKQKHLTFLNVTLSLASSSLNTSEMICQMPDLRSSNRDTDLWLI